jgi:glycosyltransferase involved in cell wall biosynthesis
VQSRIAVVPTGVDLERFQHGERDAARQALGLPQGAFVIGHVGRLAPEKNSGFLCEAVGNFLRAHPAAWFLVVGDGSERQSMESQLEGFGVASRVRWTGALSGQPLADAYSAMDVFAFASHTETQGMVLAEAMAAGVPVVAVRGTGVNDLVVSGENGWLIRDDNADEFVAALDSAQRVPASLRTRMAHSLDDTARRMSMKSCASRMIRVYRKAIETRSQADMARRSESPRDAWRLCKAAWSRWKNRFGFIATAAGGLIYRGQKTRPKV